MTRWLIAAADVTRRGGMELANWHLARHLAQTRPVELVTHDAEAELARHPNITVTLVRRPLGMNLLGEPVLRRAARSRANEVLNAGGRAVANGGNCPAADVNWVHYVHAAFAPVTAGSPLRKLKARYYHRRCVAWEKQAFDAARIIICNSQLSAKHVVECCAIPPAKVRVVYLGCDAEALPRITPADRTESRRMLNWPDAPRAVFVGALGDRRKGFDILYDAWKALCADARWDVNLAVLGRGAELEAWKARARDEGLSQRIDFLGFRDDVPRVLAACDVIVHPARYEAYGLGVQEAVVRGLPAIVSAGAGVAERIDGALGDLLLPDPEDSAALADRLRTWRTNLERYRSAVAPLAESLRRHTWEVMAREFVAVAEDAGP